MKNSLYLNIATVLLDVAKDTNYYTVANELTSSMTLLRTQTQTCPHFSQIVQSNGFLFTSNLVLAIL